MRILHVIETLGAGGAERVLLNLLPLLAERGHTCEVASLYPVYTLQDELEEAGITVHHLLCRQSRRWDILANARRVMHLHDERRYDIVHAHLLFADLYVGTSRLFGRRPRRTVTFHSTNFNHFHGSPTAKMARYLFPTVVRYGFDSVTAVSQPVANHLREHVPGVDPCVIPNPLPLTIVPDNTLDRDAVLSRWGVGPGDFAIAVAARLIPDKAHVNLFSALEILRSKNLCPKLLLAGAGPLEADLREAARAKNLDDQVIFCGLLDHPDLMDLVQACDLFALASVREGFGLAPAEAMLLERPVLATTAGGLVEVIEHGESGLLVPPGDVPALARGLETLMRDADLRARLGKAGRLRVRANFGADSVARRWEDHYRGLLRRGNQLSTIGAAVQEPTST
jgi:glycosyltransferase involved in cell wall biosynthesis